MDSIPARHAGIQLSEPCELTVGKPSVLSCRYQAAAEVHKGMLFLLAQGLGIGLIFIGRHALHSADNYLALLRQEIAVTDSAAKLAVIGKFCYLCNIFYQNFCR